MFLYIVKEKDTLHSIANNFNVSVQRLILDNQLVNPDKLVVGESILIRPDNFEYTVLKNDTISSIGKKFNISENQIYNYNSDLGEVIYPGDKIKIVYDMHDKKSMEINGFCFTDINRDVLKRTLPYLTYLSIFAYNIDEEGNIDDIDDEELIALAYKYNVAPIMTVINMDKPGSFSSDYISKVLNDYNKSKKLINSILAKLKEKNYYGVCFDFEYIYPQDKEAYNRFIKDATLILNQNGYQVLSALAPKDRSDLQGLLYTAHDYSVHGQYMDRVILMTYEWGYLYGPAMPVAPIDKVEDVLIYAVNNIDSEKILMGIPNYGYDFTLPFVEGKPAKILRLTDPRNIAIDNNQKINFDNKALTPYIIYYDNKVEHNVHFDDARSFIEKVNLAIEYNLAGLSIWTIMDFFSPLWLVIDYYIDIVKLV